ncbi:hypothetical protein M409DRAFT_22152 [Zasmidium cellare ATCC 36951]|uniref:Uncharacterized protein n=1 Tax=Zasmidium cellare ATCC 36951 TaxID=1080233 RepID=A0A6A6CL45_ZASCE|nr:uncharacterized protein M409DRAFT_22152 [Zasmidium cellare ATCC 36951]KAF2167343.1 hypothetical protein M409DRAFT_22152 [Zasmidium cellare ATCC 36951]
MIEETHDFGLPLQVFRAASGASVFHGDCATGAGSSLWSGKGLHPLTVSLPSVRVKAKMWEMKMKSNNDGDHFEDLVDEKFCERAPTRSQSDAHIKLEIQAPRETLTENDDEEMHTRNFDKMEMNTSSYLRYTTTTNANDDEDDIPKTKTMAMLRERMRMWMTEKKAGRDTGPGEAIALTPLQADPIARLHGELRDLIYEYLTTGMHVRNPPYVFNRQGRLHLQSGSALTRFGGDAAGFLETNSQYRREFKGILSATTLTHHHVEIVVEMGKSLSTPAFTRVQDTSGLVARGASTLTMWVTLRSGDNPSFIKQLLKPTVVLEAILGQLVNAYESQSPTSPSTEQVAVFLQFDDVRFSNWASTNAILSKAYWKILTWRAVPWLRRRAENIAPDTGNTSYLPDGSTMLSSTPDRISVLIQDPTSSKRLIHAQFRPNQLGIAVLSMLYAVINRDNWRRIRAHQMEIAWSRLLIARNQVQQAVLHIVVTVLQAVVFVSKLATKWKAWALQRAEGQTSGPEEMEA